MGNSGLSNRFRVVRALVWAAVGDTAGQQGLGVVSRGQGLGQGRVCQPSGIPKAPFSKPFSGPELFLCLHLRTPHLPPQPGKMCAARATTVASRSSGSGAGRCSLLSLQGIGCLAHHQPHAGVGFCLGGESGQRNGVLDPIGLSCFLVAHHRGGGA